MVMQNGRKNSGIEKLQCPHPLQQFFGSMVRRHTQKFFPHKPQYADIIAPLTKLTRKDIPFNWDQHCESAFARIKDLLTTTPVLVHPDFSKPFHIHCDASGKGIGAALSQYVNGSYRPIAFCSKRLLPHQQHWAPAQLEAYAVYYAICEK